MNARRPVPYWVQAMRLHVHAIILCIILKKNRLMHIYMYVCKSKDESKSVNLFFCVATLVVTCKCRWMPNKHNHSHRQMKHFQRVFVPHTDKHFCNIV